MLLILTATLICFCGALLQGGVTAALSLHYSSGALVDVGATPGSQLFGCTTSESHSPNEALHPSTVLNANTACKVDEEMILPGQANNSRCRLLQ